MKGMINVKIPDTTIGLGMVKSTGEEARILDARNILVITDKGIIGAGIIDGVKASLEEADLQYDVYDGCKPEPPIGVIEEIAATVKKNNYDLLIGVGGGSDMDATKVASAFAYNSIGLEDYIKNHRGEKLTGKVVPKILLPTTSGTGAEWSMASVVYDANGLGHPFGMVELLADKVIIDPELTVNLPPKITAETGFDALTHAIEAFTSCAANVFSDMLASTAIKLIGDNIRQVYAKGTKHVEARYNMSVAAAMAMNAAITGGMGLCHLIADNLQARARITHGTSLAVMLPAVMEYNLIGNPQKFARIAELLGENVGGLSLAEASARSVAAVRKLVDDLGLPKNIKGVGLTEENFAAMAKECYEASRMGISLWNSRDATEADIVGVYLAALE